MISKAKCLSTYRSASIAAHFAGLSSQSVVQPFANQQALQQTLVRPPSGGTAAASVPVNISRVTTGGTAAPPVPVSTSRVTTNTGNAGPGTIDQSILQVHRL